MLKNEVGYPVLSDDLHNKVFGSTPRPVADPEKLDRSQGLLSRFGIQTPVDYPENLYDGDLPFPELLGDSIEEHFEAMAAEFVDEYVEEGDGFASCTLPEIPGLETIVFQPGWTKYTKQKDGSFKVQRVAAPEEKAYVFDTETFVTAGAFPVIGSALSSKAAYVWLAAEMVDPLIPEEDWTSTGLIPLNENALVVGHNISYDRVRARNGYSLGNSEPENFYFDTLSAHIAVSGLAAGQRWLYVLANKDVDELSEEEKRKLEFKPKWAEEGSTNSLVNVYNFHVAAVRDYFEEKDVHWMKDADKEIRDVFVKATHISQLAQRRDLIRYALEDAYYTAELFQALWSKYKDSTPSKVGLAGHYFLNGSRIPVTTKWEDWISGVEDVYHGMHREMADIGRNIVEKVVSDWQKKLDDDIALAEAAWEEGEFDELELDFGKRKTITVDLVLKALDRDCIEWRHNCEAWIKRDPWLSQLDWSPRAYTGKYKRMPKWAAGFLKGDAEVSVKTPMAGLLLKLEWEGSPVLYDRKNGYRWRDQDGKIQKVPHPKGNSDNVGSLLSKDFVPELESGRLTSSLPEAQRALEIANATSYWTSVRKRVMDRIFVEVDNPHGEDCMLSMPEIIAHGTVTRRTVESLMVTMCSTKKHRVGTELKTRVTCPEGWKVVGADFDGQELQIASIYADAWEGGFVGASPMAHTVLSGSKEKGTDAHTKLATATNIDRDTAKIVGFAMLYGAGVRTLGNSIKRKYKDRSSAELRKYANDAIAFKKGRKDEHGNFVGGSDSGAYNFMAGIALRSRVPTLPCLGTKISTALRPSAVGTDFHTGRINWTIQSSGAEMLAILLTATHWLARRFKIPAQFILSIHDETWFMVPEKYAEQFAVMFQMAHLYSWARFQTACGMSDVPLSRAFFSGVAIDDRLRKTPYECTATPSNPDGVNDPNGEEYSMSKMAELGWVKKLEKRKLLIDKGMV